MITTLSFDLDDTLWPIAPVIEMAEAALRDWLSRHWPQVAAQWTPERVAMLRSELWQAHPQLAHDYTRLRQIAIETMLRPAGAGQRDCEEAFEVFYAARNQVQLYPEAGQVLRRLAQRYRLVAISNGNACLQRIGLADCFEASVNARGVGVAKPDPAIFHHACKLLDAAPAQVLHLGDHPQQDVAGALAAGLRAGWIDRGLHPWPERPAEVPRFACLAELEHWLEASEAVTPG